MSRLRVNEPALEATSAYYDAFAAVAEERYTSNPVLVRLRAAFRRAVEPYPAQSVLDLGCGPGTDLAWFAARYPRRRYSGIDVSTRMVAMARQKLPAGSTRIERGCAEDVPSVFAGEHFDMVYSFFGPLNTEPSLEGAARALGAVVRPQGILVLTFVSRTYLLDSMLRLLRGRLQRALARITNHWRGYHEGSPLDASLYFPGQIERCFAPGFELERREGFSIVYPAWYRAGRFREDGRFARALWVADRVLNRTPLWSLGEHVLYVFRRR